MKPHLLCTAILLNALPAHAAGTTIVLPDQASPQVKLAAKEVRRYIYLRTGELLPISAKAEGSSISFTEDKTLGEQGYRLSGDGKKLVITGGSPVAELYGAYAFVEKLGVRFYLHGDTIPDKKIPLELPKLDETRKPLFELRGIQPFHDFPDGPDWWNKDDYFAYIGQMPKMRMNFFALHCYPQRVDDVPTKGNLMIGPEPLVWYGPPQDVNPDGTVKSSYPTWWDNTARSCGWPYAPIKTSELSGGAGQMFPADAYGPDVMAGMMPLPKTPEQCNELFNRVGKQMNAVFTEARGVGVKTCVGGETPFAMPPALAEHLKSLGKNPAAPETLRELYEGAFLRLSKAMPTDYVWLWTGEGALHNNPEGVKRDLLTAYEALKKVSPKTPLATCGWGFNTSFDAYLPKDCPMSGINSAFGHAGPSPAMGELRDRPKWAIPWFQNDNNLGGYQPWVGRMRHDAVDARRFGANALLGLHWHTRPIMNNIAALAQAGWDQSYVPATYNTSRATASQVAISGGQVAQYPDTVAIAKTDEPAVYRSCRYGMSGYTLKVPNDTYKVTLKFSEPRYETAGQRVFGIKVQGKNVIEKLDLFTAAGGTNIAYDLKIPGVVVTDGTLKLDFVKIIEHACVSAIELQNEASAAPFSLKIKCGGTAPGYEPDVSTSHQTGGENRMMPIADYYADFAKAAFGPEVGEEAGVILADSEKLQTSLVGGPDRPDPTGWGSSFRWGGQGALQSNPGLHDLASKNAALAEKFVALRPRVVGAGNIHRFDNWSDILQNQAALYKAGAIHGELRMIVGAMNTEQDPAKKKDLATRALALRIAAARAFDRIVRLEIHAAETPGDLGMVTGLDRNSRLWDNWLNRFDAQLEKALGAPLPPECAQAKTWDGPAILKNFTVRTGIHRGESLELRPVVMDKADARSLTVKWRELGTGTWRDQPANHVARGVWNAKLPAMSADFEYFIEARTAAGETLHWPATASEMNQTIVVE